MKKPIARIRIGFFVLGAVFVAAVWGYYLLHPDMGMVYAVWMAVITISSVGYGKEAASTALEQLFDVGVIVTGMSATAYTLGGLVQMLTEGEIERILGRRRMEREIDSLANHVIVCGYGRIGEQLSNELRLRKKPFVVLESDSEKISEMIDDGILHLQGNATDEDLLLEAGVDRAKTIACTLPSDADNVFITLTSRNLNAQINIIARAEAPPTARKLKQAGANRVVLPTVIGAQSMARMVLKPSTADLIELLAESTFLDVELDEIEVPQESKLVGMQVRHSQPPRKNRVLFVAVKRASNEMVFNPHADFEFAAGDTIVMMGRLEDIEEFRNVYSCF
jgi:voltage-gated potassium channel